MTPDDFDADQPSYSFRPSTFGAPRNFRLLDQAITWEIGRRSGTMAFDRIDRVRLSYRPATLQTHRFVTEIWSVGTPRLDIASSSWKSMVEQVDQGDAYRAFVVELHKRLAAAGPRTQFATGMNPLIYWPGLALFIAAAIGFAGLTVRALQSDAGVAALLIAAFLLLFLWQAGNIFYRNRPGSYRPDALPPALLPRAKS
jgi:hypothetical protein